MRLGEKYDAVKVVVLDHKEQEYPVAYRVQVLREAVSHMKGSYSIYSNRKHFAQITREELDEFLPWDIYGAGNMECLKHIEGMGYSVEYVERAYDYAATDDRTIRQVLKALNK